MPVVDILARVCFSAQEAVLMATFHMLEQVSAVIETRAAELAGGVAFEATLRQRA